MVMSPRRAEGFSAPLGSARELFHDHEVDRNHDAEAKLENLKNLLLNDVYIVSLVSARKLKCPARLGSVPSLLGLNTY